MKFLSALIAVASASLAVAAVLPVDPAAVRATAAVLAHREPLRATAAVAAHATAAVLEKRGGSPPRPHDIDIIKVDAVADVHARHLIPKIEAVRADLEAVAKVAAREFITDDVLALAKPELEAPVDAVNGIVARGEPYKEHIPPVAVIAKVEEPIKAKGVVIARGGGYGFHEIPDIEALAKAKAAILA